MGRASSGASRGSIRWSPASVAVIMGKLAKGEAALAAKKQEAKGGATQPVVEQRKERSAFYQAENKARSASLTIGFIF